MAVYASPFAILGLKAGADSSAIKRAYKDLLKRYYPDREGGDGKRAAEINRAYRELRGHAAKDALEFNDLDAVARERGFRWAGMGLAAVGAVAILLLLTGPMGRLDNVPRLPLGRAKAASAIPDVM